jgi:predicted transcriptional regulator
MCCIPGTASILQGMSTACTADSDASRQIRVLRDTLDRKGVSVTRWAKLASVSRSTVYRIGLGQISPNLATFSRLVSVGNQLVANPAEE